MHFVRDMSFGRDMHFVRDMSFGRDMCLRHVMRLWRIERRGNAKDGYSVAFAAGA